jgi:hypothetical protein
MNIEIYQAMNLLAKYPARKKYSVYSSGGTALRGRAGDFIPKLARAIQSGVAAMVRSLIY